MPFQIIKQDIALMQTDAIVNTANPQPVVGGGVDTGIHHRAGEKLLEARKQIGPIAVGDAAVTPAFDLDAKYVIHAVGPLWQGGSFGEEALLRSCYDRALGLAAELGCESVAFPLISAGSYQFPPALALKIAVSAFSDFLLEHEMQIYLVVFSKDAVAVSEKLVASVERYIDEIYVEQTLREEYRIGTTQGRFRERYPKRNQAKDLLCEAPSQSLDDLLKEADAGFSQRLLWLIDRSGKKDSEVYHKANIDRKLFSKIRSNPAYQPSKSTALAFALALELDLEETKDLIGRAGFALSHSSKFDIIVEYFITHKNYDLFELNEVLFRFDQSPIGSV